MHEQCGIELQPGKEYLVESRLSRMLVQYGYRSFTQLFQQLQQGDEALSVQVVDLLTTHETLWFRDKSFFDALANTVLPRLLEKSRRAPVRIWSAGTATGQEAYSVAMLLDSVGHRLNKNFNMSKFFILGTDISSPSLATAQRGRYNTLAMSRGMRPGFLERYFVRDGSEYEVIPEMRQAVQFKQFDLKKEATALGKFDLILCRNVLIYFSSDLKQQICNRLQQVLVRPDGYFAIGASESLLGLNTGFKSVAVGDAVLYQVAA